MLLHLHICAFKIIPILVWLQVITTFCGCSWVWVCTHPLPCLVVEWKLWCKGLSIAVQWILPSGSIFLVINLDIWPSRHRNSLCFCSFCLELPFVFKMRFHFQKLLHFRKDKTFWSNNPSGETKFLFTEEIEKDGRTQFRWYNHYVCRYVFYHLHQYP